MKPENPTTIRLELAQKRELLKISKKKKVSVSDLVRVAVRDFLRSYDGVLKL